MIKQSKNMPRMEVRPRHKLFSEIAETDLTNAFVENLRSQQEEERKELENQEYPQVKTEIWGGNN